MGMKAYYEALSKIPAHFIQEDTRSTMIDDDTTILINPNYQPMIYKDGQWKLFVSEPGPFLAETRE